MEEAGAVRRSCQEAKVLLAQARSSRCFWRAWRARRVQAANRHLELVEAHACEVVGGAEHLEVPRHGVQCSNSTHQLARSNRTASVAAVSSEACAISARMAPGSPARVQLVQPGAALGAWRVGGRRSARWSSPPLSWRLGAACRAAGRPRGRPGSVVTVMSSCTFLTTWRQGGVVGRGIRMGVHGALRARGVGRCLHGGDHTLTQAKILTSFSWSRRTMPLRWRCGGGVVMSERTLPRYVAGMCASRHGGCAVDVLRERIKARRAA